MNAIAAILVSIVCCAAPAFGRLGETAAEIAARYGPPLKRDMSCKTTYGVAKYRPEAGCQVHQASGILIEVRYLQGKAAAINFWPAPGRSFLNAAEAKELLVRNGGPAGWEIATGAAATRVSATTYRRADGANAVMFFEGTDIFLLSLTTREFLQDQVAIKERRQDAEKAATRRKLKGF